MLAFTWVRRSQVGSAIGNGRKLHSWGREVGPGQNLGWSGEGKGAGSEALAPPLGYGWRAFGVILSLLDSLAAELPCAPPPCSVKLST